MKSSSMLLRPPPLFLDWFNPNLSSAAFSSSSSVLLVLRSGIASGAAVFERTCTLTSPCTPSTLIVDTVVPPGGGLRLGCGAMLTSSRKKLFAASQPSSSHFKQMVTRSLANGLWSSYAQQFSRGTMPLYFIICICTCALPGLLCPGGGCRSVAIMVKIWPLIPLHGNL